MKTIKSLKMWRMPLMAAAFLLLLTMGCNNKKDQNETMVEEQAVEQETPQMDQNQMADTQEDTITEEETTSPRVTYRQSRTAAPAENKLVLDAGSETFKNLDKDNDDIIQKDEFYDGIFGMVDGNGDGNITEQEFKDTGKNFLMKGNKSRYASFSEWDSDGNGQLKKEEFKAKMASIIDIGDNETLAENVYIIWDQDNDDKIEKLELDNIVVRFDPDDN